MLLVALALWRPAPVGAQTPAPTPAPASNLEILGIEHQPDRGVIAVRLRANGSRDETIDEPAVLIDALPAPVISPSAPAATAPAVSGRPTVLLVMDTSGSMAGAPLSSAVSAARALVGRLANNDTVGLLGFASSVTMRAPLAPRSSAVDTAISQLSATGDTALYDAIATGVSTLAASPGTNRIMVLLSDGQDSGASKSSKEAALKAVRDSSVTVYAVGFGKDTDAAFLGALADAGHGTYWSVLDNSALPELFATLGGRLGATRTVEVTATGLTPGKHQLVVRARIAGAQVQATSSFDARPAVPITLDVTAASAPDRAIVVTVAGIRADTARIDALVDGAHAGVTVEGNDRLLIDPWELAPGSHRLEVEATASGLSVARATVTVTIPALPPQLTVSNAARTGWRVATGRAQGIPSPVIVATAGGVGLGRSASPLEFAAPEGGGTVEVTLHAKAGEPPIASQTVEVAAASSTGMLMLAGAGLLLLALGAVIVIRRRRARGMMEEIEPRMRPLSADPDLLRPRDEWTRRDFARIVLRDPGGAEHVHAVSGRPLTLGSADDCDIRITGEAVRPHHVRLTATPAGELRVHGLSERRAGPRTQQPADLWIVVQAGEEVAVGDWSFHLAPAAPAEAASAQ